MSNLSRIISDPAVMGGKACIRGLRVTVATIIQLAADGFSVEDIISAYSFLEEEDVRQAFQYATRRVEESDSDSALRWQPVPAHSVKENGAARGSTSDHPLLEWLSWVATILGLLGLKLPAIPRLVTGIVLGFGLAGLLGFALQRLRWARTRRQVFAAADDHERDRPNTGPSA